MQVQKQKLKKPKRKKKTKTTSKSNKTQSTTKGIDTCLFCQKTKDMKKMWYLHGKPICEDCCMKLFNSFILDVDLTELTEVVWITANQNEDTIFTKEKHDELEDIIRFFFGKQVETSDDNGIE